MFVTALEFEGVFDFMFIAELARSAPVLLVRKTRLKLNGGQILQVQFGLFPICREGGWIGRGSLCSALPT